MTAKRRLANIRPIYSNKPRPSHINGGLGTSLANIQKEVTGFRANNFSSVPVTSQHTHICTHSYMPVERAVEAQRVNSNCSSL